MLSNSSPKIASKSVRSMQRSRSAVPCRRWCGMVAWKTLGNAACLFLVCSVLLLFLLEVALRKATEGSSRGRDLLGYRHETRSGFNEPHRTPVADSHEFPPVLSNSFQLLKETSVGLREGADVAASSTDADTPSNETKSISSSASDDVNRRLFLLSSNSSTWDIKGTISSSHNDKQACISIERVIAVHAPRTSVLSLPRHPFSVSTLTLDPSRRHTGLPLRLSTWPASSAFVIATGEPGKGYRTSLIVSVGDRIFSQLSMWRCSTLV